MERVIFDWSFAKEFYRDKGFNDKQIEEIFDGICSDLPLKVRALYEKVNFSDEKMYKIKLAYHIGMSYSEIRKLSKLSLEDINYEIQYFMLAREEERKNDKVRNGTEESN